MCSTPRRNTIRTRFQQPSTHRLYDQISHKNTGQAIARDEQLQQARQLRQQKQSPKVKASQRNSTHSQS